MLFAVVTQKFCISIAFSFSWGHFNSQEKLKTMLMQNFTAKERRLNQFGTAVLVWCGKSVKFDRVCRTFVELNLDSTDGTPSESDVAPVSLQSRTYSVRFGTWKVRRLNQALACEPWEAGRDGHWTEKLCRKIPAHSVLEPWHLL